MIRDVVEPGSLILDLGAGVGSSVKLGAKVASVVGVDSASAITENSGVAHRVRGRAPYLPFRNDTFDLVLCDWVVEHLEDPETVAAEVMRVLTPGGYFAFRTGNLFHYSYALAASTPYWFHRMAANRARGLQGSLSDPHPTYYRMNTPRAVWRSMKKAGFVEGRVRMVEAEPSYLMFSVPSFFLGLAYERLVNRVPKLARFRACILACFRKPLSQNKAGAVANARQRPHGGAKYEQ